MDFQSFILIYAALDEILTIYKHIFDELDFQFSVLGLTETTISYANPDQNIPQLKGYNFAHVPTASGGVGMYISDTFKLYGARKYFK